MKQCAACNHRYDNSKSACPRCWFTGWVNALEGEGLAMLPRHPVPCNECQYLAEAGTARCPNCGKSLVPRALKMICYTALAVFPLAIGFRLYSIHQFPWGGIDAVIYLVAMWGCWGLLHGRYLAWIMMRRLLIGAPSTCLLLIVISTLLKEDAVTAHYAGVLLLQLIGVILLWVVFHADAVRDYCAVGKPDDSPAETAPLIFPEQTKVLPDEENRNIVERL